MVVKVLKLSPFPLEVCYVTVGCPVASIIGDFASVGATPGMPLSLNQERSTIADKLV